jgi:hypothetical protein
MPEDSNAHPPPPPPRGHGEGSFGGAASLSNVASDRFETLFRLSPAAAGATTTAAAPLTDDGNGDAPLVNVSGDAAHPLWVWENFLQPEEVEFLVQLVYSSGGAEAFGTQFVQDSTEAERAADDDADPSSSNSSDDDDESAAGDSDDDDDAGSGLALSPEVAALVAAALSAKTGGGGGERVTKNRLRTSHFLRPVWWRSGRGRAVFEAMAARAGLALGLQPACAEPPQVVCYPGGATYFRCHHDSGRLAWPEPAPAAEADGALGPAAVELHRKPSVELHRKPTVELHRDHFGAARVASVRF